MTCLASVLSSYKIIENHTNVPTGIKTAPAAPESSGISLTTNWLYVEKSNLMFSLQSFLWMIHHHSAELPNAAWLCLRASTRLVASCCQRESNPDQHEWNSSNSGTVVSSCQEAVMWLGPQPMNRQITVLVSPNTFSTKERINRKKGELTVAPLIERKTNVLKWNKTPLPCQKLLARLIFRGVKSVMHSLFKVLLLDKVSFFSL